mmetsp:Transcript_16674/g.33884  ORF Transcript_16674/g.33884 Transcript_16674/m.33884 type:complete len:204 (-) Transcript_16674:76-687(-)
MVTWLHVRDSLSHRLDHTACLVTQNRREDALGVGTFPGVHVRVAQSVGNYPHAHLTSTRRGHYHLFACQGLLGFVGNHGLACDWLSCGVAGGGVFWHSWCGCLLLLRSHLCCLLPEGPCVEFDMIFHEGRNEVVGVVALRHAHRDRLALRLACSLQSFRLQLALVEELVIASLINQDLPQFREGALFVHQQRCVVGLPCSHRA